jgi:uridine kinase
MIREILRSKIFIFGLFIKLFFLWFSGSRYLTEMFIPFLDRAVLHLGTNPWSLSSPAFFPYGPVLFGILFFPKLLGYSLLGGLALGTGPLGLALVKGPLLCLDLLLLLSLSYLEKSQHRKLLYLYWLNPVLFYITYIHGQLDVAAMAFAVLSICLMIRDKPGWSALALASGLLCKFHIIILLPLMMVFIWNQNFSKGALRKLIFWSSVFCLVSTLGFLPLLRSGNLGYATMTSPEALRVFAIKGVYDAEHGFYLGLMLILTWLGRLCIARRITARGLTYGAASAFSALLLITNPMPGWYFWVFPLLSLFFATYSTVSLSLFIFLQLAYFNYFVVMPTISTNPFLTDISLTILQTVLFGNFMAIAIIAIPVELPLRGRARSIMIGLAGDSGSGKSRLSELLKDLFTTRNTLVVEGDDYHKWERNHEIWSELTHLNPNANDLLVMSKHAKALAKGQSITHPHYDHTTGQFTAPRKLVPAKVVIFQGLHTLFMRGLREDLDFRIFLEPDPKVRLLWMLQRDIKERGGVQQSVLDKIDRRANDAKNHIQPQRNFADWIIEYHFEESPTLDEILNDQNKKIYQRHVIWSEISLTGILELLKNIGGCEVEIEYFSDTIDRVALKISGFPTSKSIQQIAWTTFPNLRQLTHGWTPPVWRGGYDGVNQLLALSLLSSKIH